MVNPLTVSKNASKKDNLSPIIKGIQPIKLITIHDTVTIQKPSLAYRFLFLGFRLFNTKTNAEVHYEHTGYTPRAGDIIFFSWQGNKNDLSNSDIKKEIDLLSRKNRK